MLIRSSAGSLRVFQKSWTEKGRPILDRGIGCLTYQTVGKMEEEKIQLDTALPFLASWSVPRTQSLVAAFPAIWTDCIHLPESWNQPSLPWPMWWETELSQVRSEELLFVGLSLQRAVASLASVGDSRGGISLCWVACDDHSGGARYYGSLPEDTDVLKYRSQDCGPMD